jgi:hypothetical protein
MARKVKNNPRFSNNDFEKDLVAEGEIFVNHQGQSWNSDDMTILHHGVDTIKQLYMGLINHEVYQQISEFYDSGSNSLFSFEGYDWKVTSGRRGGYRYILKSDVLGILVLLGSHYCLPTLHGHHLKIELSPHFILKRDSKAIQEDMDEFAFKFITQVGYSGLSVHLCSDVQGWDCPDDLDRLLTTKAKRIYKASGSTSVEFEHHSIATVWGRGETFTFGSVTSLQFSVYDKGKQAKDTGSLDFWTHVWNRETLDMSGDYNEETGDYTINRYKPDKVVRRLEARFHQSVVAQFAKGCSKDFRSFEDLSDHLTGLWQYAMNNFRLDDNVNYVNPFWQFMRDDLTFLHDLQSIDYIRCYEKLENTSDIPSERQVKIWFGITCSMFRRMKISVQEAFNDLKRSGLYKWLLWYYPAFDTGDDDDDYHEDFGVLSALEYKLG